MLPRNIGESVLADEKFNLLPALPFIIMHLAALGIFFVEFSWQVGLLCFITYYLRMAAITIGYHRYFAHRSFRTSRILQFILALVGTTAAQKGPLWWAGHHRQHHKFTDKEGDPHSPSQRGFWWAHIGWVVSPKYIATSEDLILEYSQYPEIQWLDRYKFVPPFALALIFLIFLGPAFLFWGFFLSTVLLWHGTFTVNSVMHLIGSRRYNTADTSRNVGWLFWVIIGENWHNNHHYYQSSANQGFFWWEIDIGYYLIRFFSLCGWVWDVRVPPERVFKKDV